MVRLLNNYIFILCLLFCEGVNAQTVNNTEPDYQTQGTYKKFNRKSIQIGAWQIQNLKFGAIVVRLQNEKRKIDACKKVGDIKNAKIAQAEAQYRNESLVRAALSQVDFCKVYFIFSQDSDSLLTGKRSGIFLDSNLKIDPSIVMNEGYYVLMEEDFLYRSSLGFVREDSIKFQVERGYTSGKMIVFKNKYGFQLKAPFPYKCYSNAFIFNIRTIVYEKIEYEAGKFEIVKLKLPNAYKIFSNIMQDSNYRLHKFYKSSLGEQINDPELKPFLY